MEIHSEWFICFPELKTLKQKGFITADGNTINYKWSSFSAAKLTQTILITKE
jgi:hypothetical protein